MSLSFVNTGVSEGEGDISGRERTCLAIARRVGELRYGLYTLMLLQLVSLLISWLVRGS